MPSVPVAISRSPWTVLAVAFVIEMLVVALPSLDGFGPATRLFADLAVQTLLLFAIPATVVTLTLRMRLADVGLTLVGASRWCRWWAPLLALALPLALLCSRIPAIHEAYPRLAAARTNPWWLLLSTFAFAGYGLAWEFFFRGFVLFGTERRFGSWAILVQAVPCALMHWGKPDSELIAAFPAAILFGILALRTRSIVPGLVLHCSIALCINLGCVFWPLAG